MRHFEASGLAVAGTSSYYAVVNASKGGVCRVFNRQAERLAYEEAGYLVVIGKRRYTSQLIGFSKSGQASGPRELAISGQFGEVRQELPTPAKWIVLRLLNFTAFRSRTLGAWVRRRIINRLILHSRRGPAQLHRTIVFNEHTILFRDRLELNRRTTATALYLCREFTPIHMGSAKYFHPSALDEIPIESVENCVDRLNSDGVMTRDYTLQVSSPASKGVTRLATRAGLTSSPLTAGL
jgi:hypothetical protein